MTPFTMIEQLGSSGISVALRDGELVAFPKSKLTDQQREFIQMNKEILKAHLTTRPDLNPSADLQNTEDCEAIPAPMTVLEESSIKDLFSLAQYAGAKKTVLEISANSLLEQLQAEGFSFRITDDGYLSVESASPRVPVEKMDLIGENRVLLADQLRDQEQSSTKH